MLHLTCATSTYRNRGHPFRSLTAMISKSLSPAFRSTRVLITFPATRLELLRNSYRRERYSERVARLWFHVQLPR